MPPRCTFTSCVARNLLMSVAQSEHGEYISLTLLYEEPAAVG